MIRDATGSILLGQITRCTPLQTNVCPVSGSRGPDPGDCEKFPILSEVKLINKHPNFQELPNTGNHKPEELVEALRFFLIELITVLGRITADILTAPLHKELLKVTWTDPEET